MATATYIRENMFHQVALTGTTNPITGQTLSTTNAFAFNLVQDMLSGGFSLIGVDDTGNQLANSTKFILQPTTAVDSLIDTATGANNWRVYIEVRGTAIMQNSEGTDVTIPNTGLYIRIGTSSQIVWDSTKTGSARISVDTNLDEYPLIPNRVFVPGTTAGTFGAVAVNDADYPRLSALYPMSYRLTIVNRGFVIAAQNQFVTEDITMSPVFCVQRGLSCDGTVSTTGQKPLYIVTNVSATGSAMAANDLVNDGPRNNWYYSIAREVDTTTPVPEWISYQAGNGAPAAINGLYYNTNLISDPNEVLGQTLNYFPIRWYTPVTADSGEYILMFPFGLCTNRYAFSDEIDLIAVSKADAYQSGQTVPITVYGGDREYVAYSSNNAHSSVNYDSGIRVFILINEIS
jgi:hypothetical protein